MPGAGSALDRNDHALIQELTRQVERVADELERANDLREGACPDGSCPDCGGHLSVDGATVLCGRCGWLRTLK